MTLRPGPAMGLDPPQRIVLSGPEATIAWARTIPDFGWYPEVYALFLDQAHVLLRAAWLGSTTTFDDFVAWPDFSLGYLPRHGAAAVTLLVCRPGEGTEVSPADRVTWDLLRLAHAARCVPLLDVLLVDGRDWSSLAEVFD